MALAILDGTQTATTLSTILSSGQHITAHTVVSLGTQAITDMRSAVSGSVVSISSLPAISGTVTAMAGTNFRTEILEGISDYVGEEGSFGVSGTINSNTLVYNPQSDDAKQVRGYSNGGYGVCLEVCGPSNNAITVGGMPGVPVFGTVTVGNTVTIAGTVTANPTGTQTIAGSVTASISGTVPISISSVTVGVLPALTINTNFVDVGADIATGIANYGSIPVAIVAGTVTANTFAVQGTAVTTSNFTSTTASTVLASYNATREVLTIFSEGPGQLFIAPGVTCTTVQYQVRLSSGDYYEVPNHQTTITHSAVFATAGTARVTQIS